MSTATSPATAPRGLWHRWLRLGVIGVWLWVALVAARTWGPWVELACHFVPHALLMSTALLLLSSWCRRWLIAAASLLPLVYFVSLFDPWTLWSKAQPSSPPSAESAAGQQSLSVMAWNVLCINEGLAEIERVVAQHPVDVLVLLEVRPNLFEQIPTLEQLYRRRLAFPSWGGNGMAVLTNREDIDLSRIDFEGGVMPSIEVTIGGELKLVGMHTWSPMPPGRATLRDAQLRQLAQWTKAQSVPVCVIGDLNITPWAPQFERLIAQGFVDSRTSGFGNQASWPAWMGPLGIPIDHALTHGQCRVVERKLGPMVWGSDHRPVIIQLQW